jgi:hypothetical protein
VTVRSVSASADLIPDWFYAKVDVARGPSVFVFRLTRRSFDGPSRFCFFQVGEYAVRYAVRRTFPSSPVQISGNNSLCFDESGEVSGGLSHLFPVKIRAVREFIQNVGIIERVLAQWPRCPAYMDVVEALGRYRLCTNPDVATDIWAPEDG